MLINSTTRFVRRLQLMSRSIAVAVITLLISSYASVALADNWPIKPDFCFAINPGSARVEISFFPSKQNAGSDFAASYRVSSTDGQFRRIVQAHQQRNVRDAGSLGTTREYQVQSLGDHGHVSNLQPCAVVEHSLGDPPLNTGTRRFSGADNDIVTSRISTAETRNLNPAGGLFAYQARITLTDADLGALATHPNPSWNVMQRGFWNSAGGLWKMSVVMAGNPKLPRVQCLARDNKPARDGRKTLRVNSTYVLKAGKTATITCIVDDVNNQIRVVVNAQADNFSPVGGQPGFRNINPSGRGSRCRELVAQSISIGNKPACPTIQSDDRFQGSIHFVRVLKGL